MRRGRLVGDEGKHKVVDEKNLLFGCVGLDSSIGQFVGRPHAGFRQARGRGLVRLAPPFGGGK